MLSRDCTARLPGHNNLAPLLAKTAGQLFELRALAASIEAFESDEQTAIAMRAHGKNHSRACADSYEGRRICVA